MWTDIALSVSLALTSIIFVGIGVHASVSPVSPDDSNLPFWRRHRTRIWTWLAVLVIVNVSLVFIQARRQVVSSLSTDEFRKGITELKAMIGRTNGVSVLTNQDAISSNPSASHDPGELTASTAHLQIAKRAHTDTVNQITTISQETKPEILPLTADQLSLTSMGASGLAKTIHDQFAEAIKAFEDRNNANEQNEIKGWMERGKSREEASQLVGSTHTGGMMGERNAEVRGIASGVTNSHRLQIQSIVNIIASDPTRYRGTLKKILEGMEATCSVPGPNVDFCSDALNAVSNGIK